MPRFPRLSRSGPISEYTGPHNPTPTPPQNGLLSATHLGLVAPFDIRTAKQSMTKGASNGFSLNGSAPSASIQVNLHRRGDVKASDDLIKERRWLFH